MFYFWISWSIFLTFVCLHIVAFNHDLRQIIYLDCHNGENNATCGLLADTPCKTLQFLINTRMKLLPATDNVDILIAPGICNDSSMLELDQGHFKVSRWSFTGSNRTSIINFSLESFNNEIIFSFLTWQNSSFTFNARTSNITFENCFLKHTKFQFTGINSNLMIHNTTVSYSSSISLEIPLFFLYALQNHVSRILLKNSTFDNNQSPIMFSMGNDESLVENTWFYGNRNNFTSKSSLLVFGNSAGIVFKNNTFHSNAVGTVVEVINVKNFTATGLHFLSNNATTVSCLLVKQHSNVTVMDTVFEENTNPVVASEDSSDGPNQISLKGCSFICGKNGSNKTLLVASSNSNISNTNHRIGELCDVHCKNGEYVALKLYCKNCQAGNYSYNEDNMITSDKCLRCPVGTYSSRKGSKNCSQCAEGMYNKKLGRTKCKECTNDFFTSNPGARSCTKPTLELILITAATVPLIVISLCLLLARYIKTRSSAENGRRCVKVQENYDRLQTDTASKDFLSQGVYSSY